MNLLTACTILTGIAIISWVLRISSILDIMSKEFRNTIHTITSIIDDSYYSKTNSYSLKKIERISIISLIVALPTSFFSILLWVTYLFTL